MLGQGCLMFKNEPLEHENYLIAYDILKTSLAVITNL
jgi:hypothetical protein